MVKINEKYKIYALSFFANTKFVIKDRENQIKYHIKMEAIDR
jgi:hypothetical protein